MIHCPHCHHLVNANHSFCPYCGTSLKKMTNDSRYNLNYKSNLNYSPLPPIQPYHKKHHYIIGTLAIILLLAIGAGGADLLSSSNHSRKPRITTPQSSQSISNKNNNAHHSSRTPIVDHTHKQAAPVNKPGYTLAVLPQNLQGTWYSYDNKKLDMLIITPHKIIYNGHTESIKSRPKNTDAMKATKHPNWGCALIAPKAVRGIRLLNVRGWNQGAGDGDDYGLINNHGMMVLDLAGGAGAETDANFFKSKQQAKQNKKKSFKGEKRFNI